MRYEPNASPVGVGGSVECRRHDVTRRIDNQCCKRWDQRNERGYRRFEPICERQRSNVEQRLHPSTLDSRTGNGPDTDEACRLAILGNPGFNPGANFAEWIAERGPVVDRFVAGPDLQAFTLANLQTYDVVLLDRLAPDALLGISATELATWVEAGGRVIALSGYGDYPEVVQVQNALLTPLGLGFVSETPVWGPVTQFTQHPINAGLQSLTFVGGREVSHQAGDEVIMTLETDIAVGVIAVRGSGRLFLFGDEWVTFDSEWVALPEIEQFWVNIFDWLGGCELLPLGQAR